jgi:hypothetical protein
MATATANTWNLDNNLAIVGRQWAGLFALCDDAKRYAARDEKTSAWSVAQHVNHVGIAMNGIAAAIDGMLANPQQGVGLGPTQPFAIPMLEAAEIPRGRGKAPEVLHPPAAPSAADTRALLTAAKARWDALGGKRAQLSTCPATHQHFALGHFTASQWARFMAVHTAHHYKIIRDILDATGATAPFDKTVENIN